MKGQQLINEMLTRGIVESGHFKLTSGRHSDMYIHKDRMILDHELRTDIVCNLCQIVSPGIFPRADVIAGPIMGALPFAALVANAVQLPLVYPDKIDDDIVLRRGFDKFIKGKTVYIIEDIATTGQSFKKLASVINNLGGSVVGIACIWNRGIYAPSKYFDAVINKRIDSWSQDLHKNCPECFKNIPLTDPKTGKEIK
jgi:orotate phosphoribosyltransferase